MKNNRGVTLISLIVYMITISLVLGILAIISTSFHQNLTYMQDEGKYVSEISNFNQVFVEDVKKNKEAIVSDNSIIFPDGTTYDYKADPDNGIYRNKVKICSHIAICQFTKSTISSGGIQKNIIGVRLVPKGNTILDFQNEYVLKYW